MYLLQGDLFDEAVGRYCARMGVEVEDLVDAVRAKPRLRGAALTTPAEKWVELAERAQRMLRAVVPFLPPPKAPGLRLQHRYRVHVPGYEDRGGVVLKKWPDRVQQDKIHRHNKGSIIVFADGHAAWRPYGRICSGTKDWDVGYNCPEGGESMTAGLRF